MKYTLELELTNNNCLDCPLLQYTWSDDRFHCRMKLDSFGLRGLKCIPETRPSDCPLKKNQQVGEKK